MTARTVAVEEARILVVDDEEVMQDVLGTLLTDQGFRPTVVGCGEDACRRLAEEPFDLVLLDLMLPGMSGMESLSRLREIDAELPVVMITAFATVENAIEAMKRGAFDYVVKPFRNDELLLILRRAVAQRQLRAENRSLRNALRERFSPGQIVGRSEKMQRFLEVVSQAAPSRSTVLIEGESGTGKELVARAIHHSSPRADGPFVAVTCGNLAEEIQDSALFGHVRGAFPGAHADRKGLFEMADGGSLFLDEVSILSLEVQAKLLRAIQERELQRLGSSDTVQVDVRIVAATNADLRKAVEAGRFREDLFYRLNVISLQLPPLRQRDGDVPLLAAHFLEKYARENGKEVPAILPDTMSLLEAHDWPGNVRELENVIQKAVVLCRGGEIDPDLVAEDIPPARMHPQRNLGSSVPYKELVTGFEREVIQAAMRRAEGVQKRAAEILGLKPTTLNEKIKRLRIRYRA